MKNINCPKCKKELIRLQPYTPGMYTFWCDNCDLEIIIYDKEDINIRWE